MEKRKDWGLGIAGCCISRRQKLDLFECWMYVCLLDLGGSLTEAYNALD
jgi:hypothetical protein